MVPEAVVVARFDVPEKIEINELADSGGRKKLAAFSDVDEDSISIRTFMPVLPKGSPMWMAYIMTGCGSPFAAGGPKLRSAAPAPPTWFQGVSEVARV